MIKIHSFGPKGNTTIDQDDDSIPLEHIVRSCLEYWMEDGPDPSAIILTNNDNNPLAVMLRDFKDPTIAHVLYTDGRKESFGVHYIFKDDALEDVKIVKLEG